ncbi:MAG: hypothetical protein MJ074_06780 [Oscillospiraceae bacterium]|nr:hypothetical protein [Oscillospiraceae bacterium]
MWTPTYFVRVIELPPTVNGVSVPNSDGTFDIYINALLCEERRQECLQHEIRHIIEDHFYQDTKSVTQLEAEADQVPPPRLPNVFAEVPAGTIPFFSSLDAFRDYMFTMRDQYRSGYAG